MNGLVFVFLLTSPAVRGSFLSDEMIGQLESQLSDSCGDRCLKVFHDLLPLISSASRTNDTAGIQQQFQAFNKFVNDYVTDGNSENERLMNELANLTVSSFATGVVKPHAPPTEPGVPCATQAACDSLDFAINRCPYLRKAALTAYAGSNTVLSVLANMITVGCGCMFAGPANVCALRGVPYTCGFPFSAYQGIYGVSQSLYNAVTKITGVCNTGGAPPIPL